MKANQMHKEGLSLSFKERKIGPAVPNHEAVIRNQNSSCSWKNIEKLMIVP